MLINYTKLLKRKGKRRKKNSCGPAASGLAGLVATRCGRAGLPATMQPNRPASQARGPGGPSSKGPTAYIRVAVRVSP
jgi:hypothetical protein